jgi:hypothetical protein
VAQRTGLGSKQRKTTLHIRRVGVLLVYEVVNHLGAILLALVFFLQKRKI